MTTSSVRSDTGVADVGLLLHGDTLPRLSPTHVGRLLAAFETAYVGVAQDPASMATWPHKTPRLDMLRLAYRNPLDAALGVAATSIGTAKKTVGLLDQLINFRARRRLAIAEARIAEANARIAEAHADQAEGRRAGRHSTGDPDGERYQVERRAEPEGPWQRRSPFQLVEAEIARTDVALLTGEVPEAEPHHGPRRSGLPTIKQIEQANQARRQRLVDLLSLAPPPHFRAREALTLMGGDLVLAGFMPPDTSITRWASELEGAAEAVGLQPGTLDRVDVLWAIAVLGDARLDVRVVTGADAQEWTPPD